MAKSTDQLYQQVLILKCQTQQAGAFEELVTCYDAPLRFYLRQLTGEVECVDDILQDVWLDVFRKLPKLRSPRAFPVWLYRIARDKAFYMLRRTTRLPESLKNEADIPAAPESGEEETFSPEDATRIHACLDKLPLKHREVLSLRFLEEMTYEDIARVVGCTVGTVRSRIYYARRMLKEKIRRMNNGK